MRLPFTSRVSVLRRRVSVPRAAGICAACGMPMADSLSRLGSIRCHDCRDVDAPLALREPRRAIKAA
jgi:hypothetical protein